MNKKILMIINEFPPTGESGVQRPLKFLKYLDRASYETFVITPKEPVKGVLDHTLSKDVPAKTKIYHTANWGLKAKRLDKIEELRYSHENQAKSLKWKIMKFINDLVFPIDKQFGWIPFAYLKAVQVIKAEKVRNIYVTGYPFSALLIGVMLKWRFKDKIFFLADYRDAWSFEPLVEEKVLKFRLKIMRRCDKLVLSKTDHLLSVTQAIIDEYISHFPQVAGKASCITNGYDDDDFLNLKPQVFKKKTIVYMGKFYNFKGNPLAFLNALSKYRKETNQDLELIHIGTGYQELFDFVESNNYTFYKYLGYKTHQEALEYCLGADYLLLCINDDPNSKYVYSGKLFEYIRLKKPIIALVPLDGIISELFAKYQLGLVAPINNEEKILEVLKLIGVNSFPPIPPQVSSQFSREKLTKDLIAIYENQGKA